MPTTIQLPARESSTAPKRRRRPIRYAAIAGVSLVLGVSALAIASETMIKKDQTQFTADGIRELVINHDVGDITLVAGTTPGQVRVTTSRTWSWQPPPATHTVKGAVLTLAGESSRFLRLGSSDIDQVIMVPPGITIRAEVSSGNIQATGLDSPHFEVKTVSGGIDVTDLNATLFSATAASGDITASLLGATERVNAHTVSGSVDLTVPDASYDVDADTLSGKVRLEVADDPGAARLISAHTTSGDVTIRHH
jgi:hypothetical protein